MDGGTLSHSVSPNTGFENDQPPETPSIKTIFASHNPTPSAIGATVADSISSVASTTQTSVASSTTKHIIATPPTVSSTPPLSSVFTFSAGVSNSSSRSRDSPIPSIELPGTLPVGAQDGGTPRSLPVPGPYFGSLDTLKEANSSPPEHGVAAFHFGGGGRQPSPFTFRKMHNATPEPLQTLDHSTHITEGVELPDGSPVQQLAKKLAMSGLKDNSASTSNHSGSSKVEPGSTTARERTAYSRYDVKDERPPDEPYFNEKFQMALQKGKHIAGRIRDKLQACELAEDRESHVYGMIQTAAELHSFDAPAVCTIGIVGDSGVGKSSLINSLLDEADLARTAGLGRACTSVVTEYRNRKREHTAKFTIEVDCMTEDEIDEQLRELLWSYRQFYLCDLDDKGVTADEQKHLQEQSKLAWDTLQAAFGSKGMLTEEYLQDSSDGAEEKIKEQLKTWTSQLKWPVDIEKGGWLGTAETVEDCNIKTQHFLSGNLWPFVKVIRIFLSSQILKSGAILADLPGFHDSNQARVKAAEAYMYSCDEIFVVAEIGRVNTNKNVEVILQQNLGNNLKSGRPSQGIALVCTKSEDLDEDEIKKAFFKKGQTLEANRVEDLEKEIDEAEANASQAGALVRRDQAQDELNYLYMTARNEYISKIVRETHKKRFPNRSLSIFCVSNKAYKKNRKRVGSHDIPMKGSGIPALRSYCHKIPARAQFRIANHFLDVRLKDLVQRVQLWLTGASQEALPNDKTVAKLMDGLQNDLQNDISDYFMTAAERRESVANDVILNPMSQKSGKWTEAALEASAMWSSYHHTQIAAFCRNYGSWSSPKVKYTEWNLELIDVMVDDMSLWWEHLSEGFEMSIDYIKYAINMEVEKLAAGVKDFHGAPLFAEAIETKLESVAYKCSDIKKNMDSKLESIKHNATENHHGSYIYEEMLPAYRECATDSGTGVTARRLNCLRHTIGSPRRPVLFTAIRNRLMTALQALNLQIHNDLREQTDQILKQIGTDIEMLRGTEAQMLAKNGDFLDRLGEVVADVEAQMKVIGEMTAAVKAEAEKNGYL